MAPRAVPRSCPIRQCAVLAVDVLQRCVGVLCLVAVCSPAYYIMKCSSNLAILGLAVYLVLGFQSLAAHMTAALLVALFWQQCGWLSHDFLHHQVPCAPALPPCSSFGRVCADLWYMVTTVLCRQVFANRTLNDAVGYFFGNVMQGFSVAWWKNKHNTHHAVPNLHADAETRHNGDPDIDTAPLLSWSKRMGRLSLGSGSVGKFFLKFQAFLYFPILFFARISWLIQSVQHNLSGQAHPWGDSYQEGPVKNPIVERVTLAMYYMWYLPLSYVHPACSVLAPVLAYLLLPRIKHGVLLHVARLSMPWSHALMFLFVSQTFCGLFLALVFGVGHNGTLCPT
jgi:hypothetical protein